MSTPPPVPPISEPQGQSPASPEQSVRRQDEVEYRSLIEFFDRILKYTYAGVLILVGVAVGLLFQEHV
jgi:hypothetical protein